MAQRNGPPLERRDGAEYVVDRPLDLAAGKLRRDRPFRLASLAAALLYVMEVPVAPGAAAPALAVHVFHPQPLELDKPGRASLGDLEQAAPVVRDRQFVDIGVQHAPGL